MSSFHWVANCRIAVARDKYRDEGEYVPEADKWRDPDLWERAGQIRKVPGPPPGMPGGGGCHVHDLHEGECSKCEFVAPVKAVTEPEPIALEPRDGMPKSFEPKELKLVEAEPESTPEVEDKVADEILTAAAKALAANYPKKEPEPTPEPEPDPQPEPETDQEPATVPTTDSEPEPDQDDGQGEDEDEYEPHTKSELTRMRKADLQELALEWDLVVGEATKADIIHAIMEAQEEQ